MKYIQNAADSIDSAIESGVLCKGEDRIDVNLHIAERKIVISDNGLGIPSADTVSKLLSIGNSTKTLSKPLEKAEPILYRSYTVRT